MDYPSNALRGVSRDWRHCADARRTDVPAEVEFSRSPPAAPGDSDWEISLSARQSRRAAVAEEQAVLVRVERLRHLQLHPARADHVSRGKVARGAAFGDVRAR